MAKKLYKYTLTKGKNSMPVGAQILSIAVQKDQLVAWAIVEPEKTEVPTLAVFFTGDYIPPEPGRFINTFMTHDQAFVYHVFKLS